jgi:nucleotidyltransferase substrate binding protein (TIGR01987 family)
MKDRDSLIQRFEYMIEMSWKLGRNYMEYMGVSDLQYPRQVIKEMYYHKLIDELELWDRMIDMRNTLSHNYDEDFAIESAQFIHTSVLHLFQ